MFYLHTSNRLEQLVETLAQVVTHPPLNSLQKEIIAVQNRGMERWISMQLAERIGVWTNGYYPFLDTLLWQLFREVIGTVPDTSYFERAVMTWRLMAVLPDFLNMPAFSELRRYLREDAQAIKHFQLAQRIADLFERYLIFRPQMITAWEAGDTTGGWQAILWRTLIKSQPSTHQAAHPARLRLTFLERLPYQHQKLPKRLSIFGIPAFPPFHLELFANVSNYIDVHLFLLNPCCEYWADTLPTRIIARKSLAVEEVEWLHLEEGNNLLASWGRAGSEFTKILEDYNPQKVEHFIDPSLTQPTLLTYLQADILHLRTRDSETVVTDKSIQIHVCHSPMREVEILQDQLLALFEADSSLLPKDVLVMMPAVSAYAPFIQAVFTTTQDDQKQIPFAITDRSLREESILIDAFMQILVLPKGRFSVSDVLTLLEVEAIQRRFDLSGTDLALIRHWVQATAIRWGMDGADRQQQQLPAFEENTWQAGLKRLLLGYALPEPVLFHGILPFAEIEGQETLVLGKLCEFIEHLFAYRRDLTQPRTLITWQDFLLACLTRFFSPTNIQEMQVQQIQMVLNKLVADGTLAGFDEAVDYEVMLSYLRQHLEGEPTPSNFLSGQVNFCTLSPMRSIPFKVICLLGMNDQAYPRIDQPLGFDLIAQQPQLGDRSRRDSDRYLFLEALLSARNYFYISYVGYNLHDNRFMPPSILVNELQDYIKKSFVYPNDSKILDTIVTHHPLQPFSPRYFNPHDRTLFSYSKAYCGTEQIINTAFLPKPLPPPREKTIFVEQLCDFFTHPTKFLLENRLGIQFAEEKPLEKTEPFALDSLARYLLHQQLVANGLTGQTLDYAFIKASGQLPHGHVGETVYKQLQTQVLPFIGQVRQATQQAPLKNQAIRLTFEGLELQGWLGHLWADKLVYYRYTALKAKDFIRVWIYHLLLNSLMDKTLPKSSVLIGADGQWQYEPVADSKSILNKLVNWYWQGLQTPLPFFPMTGWDFAKRLAKKSEQEAISSALKIWLGDEYSYGECQDDYYQLCFQHLEAYTLLDQTFMGIAKDFFLPVLQHCISV